MSEIETIKETILENLPPAEGLYLDNLSQFFKWNDVVKALKQLVREGKITIRNDGEPAPWRVIVEHPGK